eukprot:s27_g3.t1
MKEPFHNYAYLLDVNIEGAVHEARELSLANELFRPLRVRMATPLRFTSWLRITNSIDFTSLVKELHKGDEVVLKEAQRSLTGEADKIVTLDDLKEKVLQSFEIKLGPNRSLDWLNDTARQLLSPLPLRELIVILHLLLPQVTRSDEYNYDQVNDRNSEDKTGKKIIAAEWYHLEATLVPTAKGIQGMHEVDCCFHNAAQCPAAFVSDYDYDRPTNLYKIATDKPQTLQRGANAGDVVMIHFSFGHGAQDVTYRGERPKQYLLSQMSFLHSGKAVR